MEADKEADEGMMLVREGRSGEGENEGVKAGGRRNFGLIHCWREGKLLRSATSKCVKASTCVCRRSQKVKCCQPTDIIAVRNVVGTFRTGSRPSSELLVILFPHFHKNQHQ